MLADDPLEPSYTVTECHGEKPAWEATTQLRVEIDSDAEWIYLFNDDELIEPLTFNEAKRLRQALHTAEIYLKQT